MPMQSYAAAMEFTQQEWNNPQILTHIFHGLGTDGLIADMWQFGNQELLRNFVRKGNVPGSGIVCTPSALGVELLLWAFGYGDQELDFSLTGDFSPEIKGIPKSVPNAVATKEVTDESN